MKRWYVVQTKASQEKLAFQELLNQNFNAFLPKYQYTTINKRLNLKEKIVKPLFPGYLFVEFDVEKERWKVINSTRGCIGLVACGEEYVTPVPVGCVEELINRQDKEGLLDVPPAIAGMIEFCKGMKLGIRGDNFKGIEAKYHSSTEKRVTVLLTLLSRPVKLSLPIEAVYPIHAENGGGGSVFKR